MHKFIRAFTAGRQSILVGTLAFLVLAATAGPIGMTWDEPTYIVASEAYTHWLGRLVTNPISAMSPAEISKWWGLNPEHPPADKIFSGAVWRVAQFFLDDLFAHRMGNMLLVGLAIGILYYWLATEISVTAGAAAAFSLLLMPRFFFHAHLAALDVPAACLGMIVLFAFWRTRNDPRFRYTLLLALVFGLAISVRINAAFVLPAILLWALIFDRRKSIFIRIGLAGLFGCLLLILSWPWLYYDTISRLRQFLDVLVSWPIPQYYLGALYAKPPWTFPFFMTLVVVPVGITILWITGVAKTFSQKPFRSLGGLFCICAVLPLLIIATGVTKVYDNDRFLMPAFPFLAALAGGGFDWLVHWIAEKTRGIGASLAWTAVPIASAALLVFLPPMLESAAYYPYTLSYYSEALGGLSGAARLGMETTYWSETYKEAIDFVNHSAKEGDSVWVLPSSTDVLVYYRLHGVLSADLLLASADPMETIYGNDLELPQVREDFSQANFVIVQYRQSFLYAQDGSPTPLFQWMADRTPVFTIQRDGVTLLAVFRKDQ